jgi:hypothetical protein
VHGAEDGGKGARAEDPVDRVAARLEGRRQADGMKPRGMETGRGEVERASRASLRGGTVPRAIRARRERGALEADRLVRAGKEVGIGLHAVQVRIEDGRDRHHHALLEELRRSRGHVRYYKMLSRRLRASAFAQRRARRGVRDDDATGRTHNQTARVRGCWGARSACWRVRT